LDLLNCLCIEYIVCHNHESGYDGGPLNPQGILNSFLYIYCSLLESATDGFQAMSINDGSTETSLTHFSESAALFFRVRVLIGYKCGVVGKRDIQSLLEILLQIRSISTTQLMLSHSNIVIWLIGQLTKFDEYDGHDILSLIYLVLHVIGLYDSGYGCHDEFIGVLSCGITSLVMQFWPILCTLSLSETLTSVEPSVRILERVSQSNSPENVTTTERVKSALSCLAYLSSEGKELGFP